MLFIMLASWPDASTRSRPHTAGSCHWLHGELPDVAQQAVDTHCDNKAIQRTLLGVPETVCDSHTGVELLLSTRS
jgi:hypothetical protein